MMSGHNNRIENVEVGRQDRVFAKKSLSINIAEPHDILQVNDEDPHARQSYAITSPSFIKLRTGILII